MRKTRHLSQRPEVKVRGPPRRAHLRRRLRRGGGAGGALHRGPLPAGQSDRPNGRGACRTRSHYRFVLPLIHFIPYSLTYSVPLFLKRQCDRTLGVRGHPGRAGQRAGRARQRAPPPAAAGGRVRARPHCRFGPPLTHVIPDSRTYLVPLFLKQQCDRTLGRVCGAEAGGGAGRLVDGAAGGGAAGAGGGEAGGLSAGGGPWLLCRFRKRGTEFFSESGIKEDER
jgi:hypothetical protein